VHGVLLCIGVKKKRECLSALPPWFCRLYLENEIKVPKYQALPYGNHYVSNNLLINLTGYHFENNSYYVYCYQCVIIMVKASRKIE